MPTILRSNASEDSPMYGLMERSRDQLEADPGPYKPEDRAQSQIFLPKSYCRRPGEASLRLRSIKRPTFPN